MNKHTDDLLRLSGTAEEKAWLEERLGMLSVKEGIILDAAMQHNPPDTMADAVNCLLTLNQYIVHPADSYEQLGKYCLWEYRVPYEHQSFFDMTALGHVYEDEHPGLFIGNSYVACHVFFCSIVAYGMSKSYLRGRKLYTTMGVITMFFSGGMIPTYLLIKSLGLLNSFWVYIIPALFSYYDMIVLMNFFRQVPSSLEESATIDGAGTWRTFLTIVLPLSKPALATIALFHGVSQWNDFMTAKLYINNKALYPLQMKLYEIIVNQDLAAMQNPTGVVIDTTARGVQLATIVVTTVPILVIYPLLQKHFVTGMMLGAVKE